MEKNVRCRCKGLNRSIFFLMGMFLSFSLWAQTGVICGTVTDAKLKEPLIGASVVIEGTTVGAITDIDGNFRIENVRPGTYTVTASYVSYQTQTVRDVPVVAHQEAVLRIELSDADLQLENVVVVAQRKLGTEMAVLNTMRKSLPVVNGISAQQISKTQDSDAAEVLRRIPGITIVDDRTGSPTYSLDLALWSIMLAERQATGLWHAVNSGQATWCELACEAVGLAGNECRVEPIPSSQWPQKAPRPPYTVLDCGKLSEYLGMHPRPWTQALREHFFCDPFEA